MRILSLTRSAEAFCELQPVLTREAVDGRAYGLSLIAGPEWDLSPAPYPMRFFEEYSVEMEPEEPQSRTVWRLAAARRALLEERPDVLLTSTIEPEWQSLEPLLQQLGVRRDLSVRGPAEPRPPQNVPPASLFAAGEWDGCLSQAEFPELRLRELLEGQPRLRFREPVNFGYEGCRHRLAYGLYDNDFALAPPSVDLQALLTAHLRAEQFRVEVVHARNGTAGEGPYLEACDGRVPCFEVEIDLAGLPPRSWLDRYPLGRNARVKILLVDYHNVAGSGASLAGAINRYTESRATVLCEAPHPFIDHSGADCPVVYARDGWNENLLAQLRDSDVIVYVEEDTAESVPWPDEFRAVARAKPDFSLYVGQRVHRGVAARQNLHSTVLVALPHIWRMYPRCRFWPGFYPPVLENLELRAPRSQQDGVLRVLHTPSLPHPTLHRFLYHKDTDAYLDAAQGLKQKYPTAQFWQLAGVPHARLMQARLDCDVAFHQLRGFHGLSGSESMLLGRPTVQAFDRENRHRHLEYWGLDTRFPWVEATPQTLGEKLDELLADRAYREHVGNECRRFMLEYFHPRAGIVPFLQYCAEAVQR